MSDKKNSLDCSNLVRENIDFDFYKALFDPIRVEILLYLVSNGSMNIKEVSEMFSQDRSVISRHLDLMYRYEIITKKKENRSIYYEANSEFVVDKFDETTNNLKSLISLGTSKDKNK